MKHSKKSKLLALVLVVCMALSMTVPAMAADDWSGSATASDFDWGSSLQRFFGSVAGAFRGKGGSTPGLTPIAPGEGGETGTGEGSLTLIENETTVTEGTNLRSDTYVLNASGGTAEINATPVYTEVTTTLTWNDLITSDGTVSDTGYYWSDDGSNFYAITVTRSSNLITYNYTMTANGQTVASGNRVYTNTTVSLDSGKLYTMSEGSDDTSTTLKYFPVTLYNYDKTTINNATHQVEVDNGLGNTWNGIYFNDGNPGAESYTYSTGEVTWMSVSVSNSEKDNYTNGNYYYLSGGQYYQVTSLTTSGSGTSRVWTINNSQFSYTGRNLTLYYQSSSTTTTGSLSYAAWNFWNKGAGNNDYGQYTYSGLVESTLDANKDITFTKPDGGIFNSDATVKDIYTSVELPFVYENGTYTFDASVNGAYFYADSTQGSTAAQSNGRLYFNEGKPQSNGGNYGDGSTTVWMPFNSTQSISGEANCDYHFGMRATIPFTMTANGRMNPSDSTSEAITFSFSGDDDVWIFIDGQLVIDLGGIHNRLDATINFAENTWSISESNTSTVAVADSNGAAISGTIFNEGDTTGVLNQTRASFAAKDSHELTIFYLERGGGSSNNKIQFNLPMKDTLTVTKRATQSIASDGKLSPLTAKEQATVDNIDFGFTLYKNDEKVANTTYSLLNANGQVIATPSTDANGHFTLRNGQTAKFVGEIAADGDTYYVVEDEVASKGFVLPTYTYGGTAAGGFIAGGTSYTEGNLIPATKDALTSTPITVKGSNEAEDSVQFICENFFDATLANPSSRPVDDTIVIDYGLSVVIDALANDVYRGDTIELTNVTGAQYGTADIKDGKITYQLTKQLTDVEVLTYTATVTGGAGGTESESNTAKIYIIPATSVYYEENFTGLVNYKTENWAENGTAETEPQEPGVVGTVDDSPYGSDKAYLADRTDSNGTVMAADVSKTYAQFSYRFSGSGTSFYARMTETTGYMRVNVYTVNADGTRGTLVKTTYNDLKILPNTNDENSSVTYSTLYNVPVYTFEASELDATYGTYEISVTVYPAGTPTATTGGAGANFYLDGIRVFNPMNPASANAATAYSAYASDGESNAVFAALRDKLIIENTGDEEDGSLVWLEGSRFVLFTDTNGEMVSAEDYKSIGPKHEVYMTSGQSVTFTLASYEPNAGDIYLGIKSPIGSGSVSINGNVLEIKNTTDCYYKIDDFASFQDEGNGLYTATFTITATSGLISLTNLRVTGLVEYAVIGGNTEVNP